MFKLLIIAISLISITSCYGNNKELYSKKLLIHDSSSIYDVEKIENGIVVLISRDLKKIKKIKKSFFKKEIKEGYMVTYIDDEIYINNNKKLKSEIMKLQFELNEENNKLSFKL